MDESAFVQWQWWSKPGNPGLRSIMITRTYVLGQKCGPLFNQLSSNFAVTIHIHTTQFARFLWRPNVLLFLCQRQTRS